MSMREGERGARGDQQHSAAERSHGLAEATNLGRRVTRVTLLYPLILWWGSLRESGKVGNLESTDLGRIRELEELPAVRVRTTRAPEWRGVAYAPRPTSGGCNLWQILAMSGVAAIMAFSLASPPSPRRGYRPGLSRRSIRQLLPPSLPPPVAPAAQRAPPRSTFFWQVDPHHPFLVVHTRFYR